MIQDYTKLYIDNTFSLSYLVSPVIFLLVYGDGLFFHFNMKLYALYDVADTLVSDGDCLTNFRYRPTLRKVKTFNEKSLS